MRIRRSTARAVAVLAALAIIAVACGGSAEPQAEGLAGEEDVVGQIPTVATTPPIAAPGGADAEEVAVDDPFATPVPGATEEDPFKVSVLTVNDDVQIVPAFDAPNGNNITLLDINSIDGVELEYPLYAETVFGNRLSLLVEEFDSTGNWARVQVPIRPNGTTTWVQTAFFSTAEHDYHITINVSTNTVDVFKGEDLLITQEAVSGRESRPTPLVRAYIDEKIRGETLSPAYGDWVLSIAAFSEDLGTFGGGGMPKLALHGTNQPELMGQYVSSGCVRVPNEIISFIAETVPVGTIVDIVQ